MLRISASVVLAVMLLGAAPQARATMESSTTVVLDFTKPEEVKAKALWSPADKLDMTKAGLGWDGEAKASYDCWVQTTEPIAIGWSWRPVNGAVIRAEVTPPARWVVPEFKIDSPAGAMYVRYSPDAKHWSTWQYLPPQTPTEKNAGRQIFQGEIRVPQRDRQAWWDLLDEYRHLDVAWVSDEEAAARWVLTKDPDYFAKALPFAGYVQFLFEIGLQGGRRIERLTFDVGFAAGGMHQPPKDPAARKGRDGPWRFKADAAAKPRAD